MTRRQFLIALGLVSVAVAVPAVVKAGLALQHQTLSSYPDSSSSTSSTSASVSSISTPSISSTSEVYREKKWFRGPRGNYSYRGRWYYRYNRPNYARKLGSTSKWRLKNARSNWKFHK